MTDSGPEAVSGPDALQTSASLVWMPKTAAARSAERKSVSSQVLGERGPFVLGRLTRLVFGPAVEAHIAESLRVALLLAGRRMAGRSPPIVGIDLRFQRGVVVGV